MSGGRGPTARGSLLYVLPLLLPALLAGQEPGSGVPRPSGGVLAGARVGIDYFTDAPVLGLQLHLLPDPWGIFDLMPNGEVSFRGGGTNWQLNADLAVIPVPGIYAGGGVAFRNTLYDEALGKETRTGYSLFAGIRPRAQRGEINPQIEMRWTFVGDFVRPRTITVGANWPLVLWR